MRLIHPALAFVTLAASMCVSMADARAQFGSSSNVVMGNVPNSTNSCPTFAGPVEVTLVVTQDIVVGSTTCPNNGFAMQLNANAPAPAINLTSTQLLWQQFLIVATNQGVTGFTQQWANNAKDHDPPVLGTNGLAENSLTLGVPDTVGGSFLRIAAGTTFTWTLATDSNNNVKQVTYTAHDNLNTKYSNVIEVIPVGDRAPIVSFQLDIVGQTNGCDTTFASGAGTITYKATKTKFTHLSAIPTCAVISAFKTPSFTTGETSNSAYGSVSGGESTMFTQQFTTSTQPNWSNVGHPFDGVVAGSDVDGTPLIPCRGTFKDNSVQVGKTRADWNFCDISHGGAEDQVSPFETLVAAWTNETKGNVPVNALEFGTDGVAGPPLYPCRAVLNVNDGFQVGKVRPGFAGCLIPFGGSEQVAPSYQVLTTSLPVLRKSVNSAPPPTTVAAIAAGSGDAALGGNAALIGGFDIDGAPLFVCQALFNGGLTPGKTRSNWTACDVSWGGQEHFVSSYNVLVPNFEFPVPFLTPEALLGPSFQAGTDSNGSPLGICRADFKNSEQVGKYLSSGNCNFGFGGGEVSLPLGESEALLFPAQPSFVLP